MPDANANTPEQLHLNGKLSLINRYNAIAQHTLDCSSEISRLNIRYARELSEANIDTLLLCMQNCSLARRYELGFAYLKPQVSANNVYRSNLFKIMLDMQNSILEGANATVSDYAIELRKFAVS
ncbi:hypothetical protein GQ37_014295 [Janthinobacterium sp. BJB1]|uniref:hypothetical protein n=1 Tax=Janthinobacterium sp. GW458P TaxID=1981504 RepID=UPI000A323755|nr:hypothetical protein [Janthinobacterium sp. GW458P]MBE3024311.1 hypothetical protein [Janthinobacterium sp. GW458P]PHV13741.1 hypothetical protein CSQ90_27260 [Janthinobacterium sp. BJB303]PJC98222.1 hypothetical protein GQ37_014295 [Janthinobacterium sp. BJB1]